MAAHLPSFLLIFVSVIAICFSGKASCVSLTCPRLDELAMLESSISLQCPSWIERSPVLEVHGETLDNELSKSPGDAYYAVLFYASWCPFSQISRQLFDTLNVLFPGVRHLAVEESSTLPIVLSRYGVHSFPAIFLGNGTERERFWGSKDLISLLLFYIKTTGIEPVTYLPGDRPFDMFNKIPARPNRLTAQGFLRTEPYLALSFLFLLLRALVFLTPKAWAKIKALCFSHVPNADWTISIGWDRLLERVLLMVDLKRHLVKLRICEKRSLRRRASNARVWASTLTSSVALSESGPSRSAASSSS